MIQKDYLLPRVYVNMLARVCLLLLLSQGTRLLFFLANKHFFNVASFSDYLSVIWHSLRFDLSALFTVNAVFLLIALFPHSSIAKKGVQTVLSILFVLCNGLYFIFEFADIAYFPYVRKRMSADVFDLISKKSDFIDLLPNYLSKFWYVSALFVLGMTLLVLVSRYFSRRNTLQPFSLKHLVLYLLSLGIVFIAIRGGVQLRPITLSNAMMAENNANIPLVINTPFSILQTLQSQKLRELHFVSQQEIDQWYRPIKNYQQTQPFEQRNVVVIVLESFGKAFTGIGGRTSYTPFLDSLMQHSLTFTNAYANATRSADGVPAILSGIPYLMNDAFPMSPYATNQIDALPSLLKEKGYTTSFFHGGANGTMNFDSYSRNAGFEHYYGRNEYHNDEDYDGTWGIWDEPFLQYFCQQLNAQQQPFCSAVFTLSSHEPFHLPTQYANASFATRSGISRGISYTDMALRKFFAEAAQSPWFHNTLFVITADHHYLAYHDPQQFYQQGIGLFAIPIIFYQPGNTALSGFNDHLIQQIDIMPSVLDLLHYDRPFFSFGKSVFDTTATAMVCTAVDQQYFMLHEPWLITSNFDQVQGYYDFAHDTLLQNNLRPNADPSFAENEKRFHAFLQFVNNCVLHNRQSLKTYRSPL